MMDIAGSAVGIASLGIQVCQGLLSYYNDWKSYSSDISSTYSSIDDLSRTLALLKASLNSKELDEETKERVSIWTTYAALTIPFEHFSRIWLCLNCHSSTLKHMPEVKSSLQSCEESLASLSQRSQKLRKYGQPAGSRQRTWAELQRACYPFRAKTLTKLQETVSAAQERLKLAVQILQLKVGIESERMLKQVAVDASDAASLAAAIEAQNSRIIAAQQSDQFRRITAWLSAPDPWTNHESARQRYEPQTGTWLLQSNQYVRWKAGDVKYLWLYGKAGCGKTVLCSTVIEDIRGHCETTTTNFGYAAFYFSFSDNQKQSYENLLRSLVVQLGWVEPGLSMLIQAYEKSGQRPLGLDDLESILLSSIESFSEVFLLLDALDECPEAEEVRQNMLESLERLLQRASNVRVLLTSREVSDIRQSVKILRAEVISVSTDSVDTDIQKWVSSELLRDRKLRQLDATTKASIESTISQKADGMFRWAYCQLQEVKKLKSTRPKYVEHALRNLPTTLDATYNRMLTSIEDVYREEALILLRWLTYAKSPPSLGELAEAAIIDPEGDGFVDTANRGPLEGILEILCGLVTISGNGDDSHNEEDDDDNDDNDDYDGDEDSSEDVDNEDEDSGVEGSDSHGSDVGGLPPIQRLNKDTKIRLAHFSVKEYLESKRICDSNAKMFSLESAREHRLITHSCLTYLTHYSRSEEKTSTEQDLVEFPLLEYAARSWWYHSSLHHSANVDREMLFLRSDDIKRDWLFVFLPDEAWGLPFAGTADSLDRGGSDLYYASYLGLEAIASELLRTGSNVNAQGGRYGNALQAASSENHWKVVKMLIDAGADVNTNGGIYSNALLAASVGGCIEVVEMLIDAGAEVNAQGGPYSSALQAAAGAGHEKVVAMLIKLGAEVNAQGGPHSNALQAAAYWGREEIVKMLIKHGADVNIQGRLYGSALQTAAYWGREEVVEMLIKHGADVNAQGGNYGSALQAASRKGRDKIVSMLIAAGAKA